MSADIDTKQEPQSVEKQQVSSQQQQQQQQVVETTIENRHNEQQLVEKGYTNQHQTRRKPSKRKRSSNNQKRTSKMQKHQPPAAAATAASAAANEQQCRCDTPTNGDTSPERVGRNVPDNICAACLRPIRERYLLVALDKQWHEDCLKCACCDCRLGEVGSSLFTHADKILCRRDYLRIFGPPGHCAACKKPIPPYELVMKAQENAYHMDCFACQQCQYRFCVGDQFYLTEAHRIVCMGCQSDAIAAAAAAAAAAATSVNPPPRTPEQPPELQQRPPEDPAVAAGEPVKQHTTTPQQQQQQQQAQCAM